MFGASWRADKRWALLYCGVDFTRFAQRPDPALRNSLGIPASAFVIGHVGRFHEQKNHHFVVEIAQKTVKICPDAHFLFIGDGDLRSDIVSEFRKRNLDRSVTFVPDTLSVPKFMLSVMDCLALPSRYEGLGLVVVEAQAAGLPCLISDRVPREAIVDTKLVTALPLDDGPEVWATALMNAKGRRAESSEVHLQQFYGSQFNLSGCVESLGSTYEALVRSTDAAETSTYQS